MFNRKKNIRTKTKYQQECLILPKFVKNWFLGQEAIYKDKGLDVSYSTI